MVPHYDNEHVYSNKVKAGKRTYFFDVKETRGGDYYLVITESKKEVRDGEYTYKKNKVFLYKEDLNNFVHALQNTTEHIKKHLLPNYDFEQNNRGEHPDRDGSSLY